jgi:hypothetical protein
MTDSAKLDQLLGLVATMNTWLDHQSQQLATVEMAIPLLAQLAALPFRQDLSAGALALSRDQRWLAARAQHRLGLEMATTQVMDRTTTRLNLRAPVVAQAQAEVVASLHMAVAVADRAVAVLAGTTATTKAHIALRSLFHPSMVKAIRCPGLTSVPYTFTAWAPRPMRGLGWLLSISTASRSSGTMCSNMIWGSSPGHTSSNSSI